MAQSAPFEQDEIDAYIQRTNAQRWLVLLAMNLSRYYFPSEADWLIHSPFSLAQNDLGPDSARLYFANGLADEFGFHEGNLAFVEIATQKDTRIKSHFYQDGGHCDVDQNPPSTFLCSQNLIIFL